VDGDRVRLAADVTGSVSLPQGEPDLSGLSRNGVGLGLDAAGEFGTRRM
jgi:hypothetical protein